MKKIIALILTFALIMSLAALTGCTGGNQTFKNNFEIPEGGYDGSEVEIVFYHTMGSNLRDVLDYYIAEFNEMYPNIKITHSQVGSYDDVRDKVKTELTVGAQPNITYCYPDHVALYNLANAVVTLDDLIASEIVVTDANGNTDILGLTDDQINDFIAGYYNEGKTFGDGLMYTMPLSKSTEVLYYNKTYFEEHNLTVPTTWEEMETLCETILEIEKAAGREDNYPLAYDSESNWFITLCEQYGYDYTTAEGDDHYLFDNEGTRNLMTMLNEWYNKGYVTTQELYGTYTSGLFTETDGQCCYMCIGSSAGATYQVPDMDENGEYAFEVGIATIPQADASNAKVISQGPSLCILKSDNDQEVIASWLFVKYLCTCVEFQAEFSMVSGYVPVIKSVTDNDVYADFLASADGGAYISALSAQVCMDQESAYFTSPAFNGSSAARDAVGNLLVACLVETDLQGQMDTLFKNAIANAKK